jgi:hypothetical protein
LVVAVLGGILASVHLVLWDDKVVSRRSHEFCDETPIGSSEQAFRARATRANRISDHEPEADVRPARVVAWFQDMTGSQGCQVDVVEGVAHANSEALRTLIAAHRLGMVP